MWTVFAALLLLPSPNSQSVGVRGDTSGYRAGEGHGEGHGPLGWRCGDLHDERRRRGWRDGSHNDRRGLVPGQPSSVLRLHGDIVCPWDRELVLCLGVVGPWGVPDPVAFPIPSDLEQVRRILRVK